MWLMDDSKLNKKEYAQKAYKELQAIYTDATKSNNDKANSFKEKLLFWKRNIWYYVKKFE